MNKRQKKKKNKVPDAIEFLKHAIIMCDKTGCECGCPLAIYESDELISCKFEKMWIEMGDNEIADLVREVERWWEENERENI